jgi:hypothetical protein
LAVKPLPTALLLVAALAVAAVADKERPTPQAEADIEALKDAGIQPDEAELEYLRDLHLAPVTPRQIRELIAQLASDNFGHREDAARRLSARAGLARTELDRASRSTDPEVARRAKSILADYDAGTDRRDATLLAVLREVTRRKTPGAVPLLLDVLPLCRRYDLRQAAERALTAAARPEDFGPLRRALGAGGDGVRLAAAVALLDRSDRRALPV